MNTATTEPQTTSAPRAHLHALAPLIAAAYILVYLAWGGTFLGIRVAMETIPAFLMAGSRFLIAGLILLTGIRLLRSSQFRWGTPREWRDASVVGLLMVLMGNGGITWSERVLPSGVAALVVALTPLWMVLFDWLRPAGQRPSLRTSFGLLLGFGGICILRGSDHGGVGSEALNWSFLALFIGNICWGAGAIYSRHAHAEGSPLLPVARQMIIGGAALLTVSAVSGEFQTFSFAAISLRSALGYAYLILFGSLLGFTAYVWLMKVSTPARVGTISYVNPIIAVLLGWSFGGEDLTLKIAASAVIIVIAVVIVIRR